jgi:hypothetical protein
MTEVILGKREGFRLQNKWFFSGTSEHHVPMRIEFDPGHFQDDVPIRP